MRTRFTDLFGCTLPLQLAGMGGVGTPELAAAVARAGGLGMLPAHGTPLDARLWEAGDAAPDGVLGVNMLMPFLQDWTIIEAACCGARLVEFFYGDPSPALVAEVHNDGALAGWQVGSADEARAAVDAGCDIVVVQGIEAGGHVRGTMPLLSLLDRVLDLVDVPVVAAGGITTARHIAAALAAGADAVRMGTRFLATPEADVHPAYLDLLLEADGEDTVLTTAFGNGWPDAPHRVLASSVTAASALPDDAPYRFSPVPPTRGATGDVHAMATYAGTGVGSVTSVEPAESLATRLMAEAIELLRRQSA